MREEERKKGRESQYTQHRKRGRLERKEKSQKSSPGGELAKKSGRRNSRGPGGNYSHKLFMQDVLNVLWCTTSASGTTCIRATL